MITVKTGTRPIAGVSYVERHIHTVEVHIAGVVFRTDATDAEHARALAFDIARELRRNHMVDCAPAAGLP